jgi:hypothetical protein
MIMISIDFWFSLFRTSLRLFDGSPIRITIRYITVQRKEIEMTNKSDIKKALETILGHELTEEAVELIGVTQLLASFTRSNLPGEGFITKKSIITNFKRCEQTPLLDLSGFATTGKDGKCLFRLTDFICPDPVITFTFGHPVNFVATPFSAEPRFLTVLHSLVTNKADQQIDVEIQVSTWGTNGVAAPNVAFDWRCRVPMPEILI